MNHAFVSANAGEHGDTGPGLGALTCAGAVLSAGAVAG